MGVGVSTGGDSLIPNPGYSTANDLRVSSPKDFGTSTRLLWVAESPFSFGLFRPRGGSAYVLVCVSRELISGKDASSLRVHVFISRYFPRVCSRVVGPV